LFCTVNPPPQVTAFLELAVTLHVPQLSQIALVDVFPFTFVQAARRVCVPLSEAYAHVPLLTVQPVGVHDWLVEQADEQLVQVLPFL
jgi:hypothetical protein